MVQTTWVVTTKYRNIEEVGLMISEMRALVSKLNPTCKKALEGAAALCVAKTHYTVELEHFLFKLIEMPNTDIQAVLRYYELDSQSILKQLSGAIDQFKIGNTSTPALSPHIMSTLEQAWMFSSLQMGQSQIRSGSILLMLIDIDALRGILMESCPLLFQLPRHTYREDIHSLLSKSPEIVEMAPKDSGGAILPESSLLSSSQKNETLEKYTFDLTEQAREGKLDPIYGRDSEIRQLIDVLSRRRQNNPILVGEAGVGKTAIVEGLAQRIARGAVPPSLKQVSLRLLDVGLLQAGAGMKGEFEERLQSILNEVKSSEIPIILFIDEAHTLIGAGGQAGLGDAANLLKPALARGELRTIAATTWGEYKRYIEKDPALSRRFELVKVEEPSPEKAVIMVRSMAHSLAKHHGVQILDEAIQAAVTLSQRFLSGRRLPDKAVSVLDTACAQVALGLSSSPESLEALNNRMHLLKIEADTLKKELKGDHNPRIEAITKELRTIKETAAHIESDWQHVGPTIAQIHSLKKELSEFTMDEGDEKKEGEDHEVIENLKEQLLSLEKTIETHSVFEKIPHHVDRQVIAEVISGWTGIPVDIMLAHEEGLDVQSIQNTLQKRIIGQQHALGLIARHIVSYRAHLTDPNKPMGAFLLIGPSGVGKTETAQALAEIVTGQESHLIRFNMSEFQEAHSVATLKGSPPGYVGYGKGGVLTEAVRRNPYSVILLDEVEKAHPDVMKLFYQVFDKGTMEDAEGLEIDFTNCLIILTSNLATDEIMDLWESSDHSVEKAFSSPNLELIRNVLSSHFPMAFLARLTVIPYHPLTLQNLNDIIRLKLGSLDDRLMQQHLAHLVYTDKDISAIAQQCSDQHQGARAIDHILTEKILPDLSAEILAQKAKGIPFDHINLPRI